MFRNLTTAAVAAAILVGIAAPAFASAPNLGTGSARVQFNMTPRVAGNGYTAARPVLNTGAPKGILKGAAGKQVRVDLGARTAGNGYAVARPTRTVGTPKGILKGAPSADFNGGRYADFRNGLAQRQGTIDALKRGQQAQTQRLATRTAQARADLPR